MGQGLEIARSGGGNLSGKFFDPGYTGAGSGLIGAGEEAFQAPGIMQRFEHGHGCHRGAVGVCDDALGKARKGVRIHLGHHQRHVGIFPPGGGIVDHDGPSRRKAGRILARGFSACGKEYDVEAGKVRRRHILHDHLATPERDGFAGRPGGRKQAQRGQREIPLGQKLAHQAADKAGGADDADTRRIGS